MQRIESLYESYFTTRYLATASRDISIDYFATANAGGGSAWDSGGNAIVSNTSGNTQSNAYDYLHQLGVSLQDATTPYETDNQIKIGNYNECWGSTCVRSSANVGAPPFTAVLFAQLPGPSGAGITQTVTGNY
jgi:predicted aconitase